ncbi:MULTISPECIES: VOC family protein [Aeromonas]|uniref:VOC family protein n=1 Tax=Aeromonas TaxID=642 RepID=UPI00123A6DA2|nr:MULTISPECIES: VOC family protein [Aeromonas]MCX0435805.1 VOC family protein [Aeromonas veronii]QET80549.1 VOC family protein [Aeromonas veronii]
MAIPGLKKPDHIGFTVPNLAEAIAFFRDHFDFELAYEFGPFVASDNWMAEHLNVHARAEITRIAVMNAKGINLEIFEYASNIERNLKAPNNADIGGHHLAFYVDDMAAAVAYLKERGIAVLGEPTCMTEGPTAGESWVYFLAPWGMQLELVSYPQGKAYSRQSPVALFDPR